MLATVLQSRGAARAALASLAVGLVALASLAVWDSVSMERAAAEAETLNHVNDQWGQVFQHVNLEDTAMRDYLGTGTDIGRERLANAVGRAEENLSWLRRHGGADNTATATRVGQLYADYTATLRELMALRGRGENARAALQANQAELASASLRKQISVVIQRKRLETTEYIHQARARNRQIRLGAVAAFGVDVGLLGICTLVLLAYQRRIERQAAASEHDARHDSLTGLPNRALLYERTARAVREADRYEDMPALLLIDLDRFKEVNDTLGHHTGDRMLREVAARLTAAVRDVDTVARLGGDEFAVLLPRIGSVDGALAVAHRIQAAFDAPLELDGLTLEIGGSIGLALYPVDAADPEQLLQHADVAMYTAKRGQLGVAVYEPGQDAASVVHLHLVSELRHAIDNSELVLHYQPKALADTGEVCGVEALVRWQHPQRGLLAPMEFIPVAEENGLIEPLTRWVLTAALEQNRRWLDAGLDLPVSVNIGARSLQDTAFPQLVAALLTAYDVPARLLTLEITESAFIADPGRATAVLHRLEELGVRLSIDDFGTGYSAISYLRTLRVHEMKLDRQFVTHMRADPGNGSIVRALLDLGRDFRLKVVAEGVEDGETWDALSTLGCDIVQGYYLSRPLPEAALTAWLREQKVSRTPATAGALAPG